MAWATRLANGPTFALGMTKELLNGELNMDLWNALENEARAQAVCMQTQDFREAYDAFSNKRPPQLPGEVSDVGELPVPRCTWSCGPGRARPSPRSSRTGPLDDAQLKAEVARLGFYPYLVPAAYGGALAKVEVLSICVLREELRVPQRRGRLALRGAGPGQSPGAAGGHRGAEAGSCSRWSREGRGRSSPSR